MSFQKVSPASFIGGTWSQITDRVLRAADDTETGGSDTCTLTVNQIPSHNHQYTDQPSTGSKFALEAKNNNTYNGANVAINKFQNGNWTYCSIGATPGSITAVNTGGGEAHNNLPAYQNLYCYQRTA